MAIVKDIEPNDNQLHANAINLGDTITGALSSATDYDFYKVTLSTDGVINLDVSVTSQSDWGYTVKVLDANGTVLGTDYFGYYSTGDSFSVGAAAGTYYIAVTSSNAYSSNPYTIVTSAGLGSASDYEKEGNNTLALATAVSMDHVITGQRAAPGDTDYFSVSANSSGMLTLDFQAPEKEYFADYQVSIYDASGKLIESRTGNGNMTQVAQVAAGKYYIGITPAKDADYEGGNYKFIAHADPVSASSAATALTSAAPVNGAITAAGQHDWYKIELSAGQLYEFSASGATSGGGTLAAPSVTLLASDGHTLQYSTNLPTYTDDDGQLYDADPQLAFVAPYSGTYYMMVDGLGGTGSYTLQEKSDSVITLIKSLLDTSSNGSYLRWGSGGVGASATVTYAFMTTSRFASEDGETGFKAMTDTQQQAVRDVLAMYGSFANVKFVEVSDENIANVVYGTSDQSGISAGVTYSSWNANGTMTEADVFINNKSSSGYGSPSGDTMYPGGYGYETLIHETGHALGLKHPGNYDASSGGGTPPYIAPAWDDIEFTIMSYVDSPEYHVSATTPGLLDIAAIQYLYSERNTTATQTETFAASGEFKQSAIDTGAVTFDLGNQTADNIISATPGTFSSIGYKSDGTLAHDNVAMPFTIKVKTVIGGSGNDYILGGPATALYGGTGDDIFNGCATRVAVNGGNGTDKFEMNAASTAEHVLALRSGAVAVADASGNVALCRDIEQIQFTDAGIATSSLSVHDNLDQILTQIYMAAFKRVPETGGYNYWLHEETTRGLTGVADVIFSLDSVKTIYPIAMSGSDFVTAIYQNVFNRAPDTEGLNYWVQQLTAKSRGQLVIDMTNAALGTPDGTSGKDYFENRMDWALYAVGYQLDKSTELAPDHLTMLTNGVTADAATVITLIGQAESGVTI
jgi:hypothetical protein